MQRISALTMRKKFGKYLDLVADEKEPVVVERGNRPMVVLIPADDLEAYERQVAGRARREEAIKRMDAIREGMRPVDVVELVRRGRDSR